MSAHPRSVVGEAKHKRKSGKQTTQQVAAGRQLGIDLVLRSQVQTHGAYITL